jgi:CelD/BcsL family acetyltransferase involved in cellulose biosynthesis
MLLNVDLAPAAFEDLVLDRHDRVEGLREEWNRLAEQAGNVFMTWEWADIWLRHLRPGAELAIMVARDADGDARVILPLFFDRRQPLKLVRFIGSGPADELGPICAPQDAPLAASLLRSRAHALLGSGGVLLAERLSRATGVASELPGRPLRRYATPLLPLDEDGFEEFLAARSRNFRGQLRRAEHRLQREHQVVYRRAETAEQFERDWETLVRLHEHRWRGERLHTFIGKHGEFQRVFARRALQQGWLRLWTMELDGRPAASWYGLRFAGVDYYYQSGRDPGSARLKVGFVLLAHTIRDAFAAGQSSYRFGLGHEPYKSRFTDYDPGLETTALASGLSGRVAVQAVRAGLYVRDHARRARAQLTG